MSLSVLSFFVNTPIPWAAILCIMLYRYDLSQLRHPSKERCSTSDWQSVFRDLGIVVTVPGNANDSYGIVAPIHRLSEEVTERYPNTGFYCLTITVVACSSLIASLAFDVIFPDLRFVLLMLVGLQFLSALPAIPALQRYFGPFPSPPFKYHLKRRRSGSLLRYEEVLSFES
jgi:hypothetical protein